MEVIASGSYNVGYTFLDVESLLGHLQAVPLREYFDIERHGERVLRFIQENQTVEGHWDERAPGDAHRLEELLIR